MFENDKLDRGSGGGELGTATPYHKTLSKEKVINKLRYCKSDGNKL